MTALALAGSGAALGARGPATLAAAVSALAEPPKLRPRIEARLMAPKPMPVRSRNSRRVKMMSFAVGRCSRRYFSELRQVGSMFIIWRGWDAILSDNQRESRKLREN